MFIQEPSCSSGKKCTFQLGLLFFTRFIIYFDIDYIHSRYVNIILPKGEFEMKKILFSVVAILSVFVFLQLAIMDLTHNHLVIQWGGVLQKH